MSPDLIIARFWETHARLGTYWALAEILQWYRSASRQDQTTFTCSLDCIRWTQHPLVPAWLDQKTELESAARLCDGS